MTEKMKALVAYAPYDYRYEDTDRSEAGSGEIILKILACGICAGDVKAFHGGIRIWGTSPENRYIEAPVIGGLAALKNLGRYVQMGVFAEEVKADWNIIGDGKELKVIGSHLSALTYASVIKGIQNGYIKTEGLISHQYALKDWKEAFEATQSDPDAVKIMLIP